jgi:hypothetical protein
LNLGHAALVRLEEEPVHVGEFDFVVVEQDELNHTKRKNIYITISTKHRYGRHKKRSVTFVVVSPCQFHNASAFPPSHYRRLRLLQSPR